MGVYFKRNHFSFLLEAIPFEKGFDVQESKEESQKLSALIYQVYQVPQKDIAGNIKKKKKERKKDARARHLIAAKYREICYYQTQVPQKDIVGNIKTKKDARVRHLIAAKYREICYYQLDVW